MSDLKPCRKCGGETIFPTIYGKNVKEWGVLCNGCDAWIEGFATESEAIAAWNTRAPVSVQEAAKVLLNDRDAMMYAAEYLFNGNTAIYNTVLPILRAIAEGENP